MLRAPPPPHNNLSLFSEILNWPVNESNGSRQTGDVWGRQGAGTWWLTEGAVGSAKTMRVIVQTTK